MQPRSPKMRCNLAIVRNQQGRYEEALEEAAAAMRLDGGERRSRDAFAFALEKLDRNEEAIGAGLSDDPKNVGWLSLAAKRLQDRGASARAIDYWREVIKRSPGAVDARLHLGICLLRVGDPGSAAEAYAEALRLSPESAQAANGLAWSLLESGASADDAVLYAKRAVERSQAAHYFDTLARAYLAAGNCGAARNAAMRAIEIDSLGCSYQTRLSEIEAACAGSTDR